MTVALLASGLTETSPVALTRMAATHEVGRLGGLLAGVGGRERAEFGHEPARVSGPRGLLGTK